MTINELYESNELHLPINWKLSNYDSYYSCVINKGRNYLKILESIEDNEFGNDSNIGVMNKGHLLRTAQRFYQLTFQTLQAYLNEGNPYKAYDVFDEIMKSDDDLGLGKQLFFYLALDNLYPASYRLRVKDSIANYGDLFHVPFELRHIVDAGRYSIPGYPTLYLSNSIFLAYKELVDPDFDSLWVSKFRHSGYYNKRESLLNMRFNPIYDTIEEKFKYLCRWILIMACRNKVGYPNAKFKSEYVIPQIIFQWTKNNIFIGGKKIIGTTYSSTKIDTNNNHFKGSFYNTAIPIHTSLPDGYCHVQANRFDITKPQNISKLIKEVKDEEIETCTQVHSVSMNGVKTKYDETDFYKVEKIVSRLEGESINEKVKDNA